MIDFHQLSLTYHENPSSTVSSRTSEPPREVEPFTSDGLDAALRRRVRENEDGRYAFAIFEDDPRSAAPVPRAQPGPARRRGVRVFWAVRVMARPWCSLAPSEVFYTSRVRSV